MPAPNYKGHAHPYVEAKLPRLSKADEMGHFVEVTCQMCRPRIVRNYRPADVIKLIGDCNIFDLRQRFYCERCGSKEYMDVNFRVLIGDEAKGFPVRELVDIKLVRKPIWRDVTL